MLNLAHPLCNKQMDVNKETDQDQIINVSVLFLLRAGEKARGMSSQTVLCERGLVAGGC